MNQGLKRKKRHPRGAVPQIKTEPNLDRWWTEPNDDEEIEIQRHIDKEEPDSSAEREAREFKEKVKECRTRAAEARMIIQVSGKQGGPYSIDLNGEKIKLQNEQTMELPVPSMTDLIQ